MFDIFAAGVATSKAVLSFCLLVLANDPDLQEELREEIINVVGPSRVCVHSDRVKMPKLDSYIQEVIRFFPPVPLALPRKATTECTMSMFRIL